MIGGDAEELEDRGGKIGGADRAIGWHPAAVVARADHATARHASAGQGHREDAPPVIAATGGIDRRRATEFPHHHDERLVEEATVLEIVEERAVGSVELRAEDVLEPAGVVLMGVPEWISGGRVPRLARPVDLDEPHPGLDQPSSEEHTLAELSSAVAIARSRRLALDLEGLAGGACMEEVEGFLLEAVHLRNRRAAEATVEHPIDLAEERVAVVEAQLRHPGRGRQSFDLDPLLRRIAAEDVRMPGRPHEATVLPRPGDRRIVEDRLGEDDRIERRAFRGPQRADGAGEARPVLGAGGHALGHARRLVAGEHEGAAGGVGMNAGRHRTDDAHPMGAGG